MRPIHIYPVTGQRHDGYTSRIAWEYGPAKKQFFGDWEELQAEMKEHYPGKTLQIHCLPRNKDAQTN